MPRVYIIAELSANHGGDKEVALRSIEAAKAAGADAVKVQTYTADTLTLDCRSEAFLLPEGTLWAGQTLHELYRQAAMPWEWQGELKAYADALGIEFFSTPFDVTAVDYLEKIGVPRYKIASFEAIDYPLIRYTASKGKPMIISVGISALGEMQEAVDACHSVGNRDVTLLKCTSAYPAKVEDMHLLTIRDMQQRFGPQGVKIGLSDHSLSMEPAVAAVALGACAIEKHFILDRALGGADSAFSLNEEEFAAMVRAVRNTELALGEVSYTCSEKNRKLARSIFAVRDIRRGEAFTPANVRSIRPADGLHPRYYDVLLRRRAARDIARGTPLDAACVQGGLGVG